MKTTFNSINNWEKQIKTTKKIYYNYNNQNLQSENRNRKQGFMKVWRNYSPFLHCRGNENVSATSEISLKVYAQN